MKDNMIGMFKQSKEKQDLGKEKRYPRRERKRVYFSPYLKKRDFLMVFFLFCSSKNHKCEISQLERKGRLNEWMWVFVCVCVCV